MDLRNTMGIEDQKPIKGEAPLAQWSSRQLVPPWLGVRFSGGYVFCDDQGSCSLCDGAFPTMKGDEQRQPNAQERHVGFFRRKGDFSPQPWLSPAALPDCRALTCL